MKKLGENNVNLGTKRDEIQADIEKLDKEIKNERVSQKNKRVERQKLDSKEKEHSKNNTLDSQFGDGFKKLCDEIQNRSNLFKNGKPVGPIGSFVKLSRKVAEHERRNELGMISLKMSIVAIFFHKNFSKKNFHQTFFKKMAVMTNKVLLIKYFEDYII